jgi:predicted N-formylglutamate amidohydrolase
MASSADPSALLGPEDPAPFEVTEGTAASPWVILCDHASRRIPRALGALGLPESELARHIAWDIGAADVARALSSRLGAWLILQGYSRLVIDCNRRPERHDSIAERSEDTDVPGNRGLSPEARASRVREVFEPYHARITQELDERAAAGRPSAVVLMHTFTPTYRGVARTWHAGVLHHRDIRLARPMLERLRAEPGLVVGDNQPYAATALNDYGIVEHAEARGLLHVELEVRQDLVSDTAGAHDWAERLARLLSASLPEAHFADSTT